MRALGCPVRAAMRGLLVPFQALPSEGHFLVRSAAKLPRAQQCCGAPTRRNGLRLPGAAEASVSHAPRRFRGACA